LIDEDEEEEEEQEEADIGYHFEMLDDDHDA